jgi:O-antigen ligase
MDAAATLAHPALRVRPAWSWQHLLERAAILMVVLWLVYDVNGLRPPWSPIVVGDADSGAGKRQMLFSAAGMMGFAALFLTRRLGAAITGHIGVTALATGLLCTVLYSPDRVLTIKRAVIFGFGLMALLAVVRIPRCPVRMMQRMICSVTMAAAWISLLGWVALPRHAVSIAERPGLAGVAGHPNTLGPAMVIGFMVSLGLPRPTLAVRAGQAGLLAALYLSNSVTSILMLMLSVLLYASLLTTRYRRGVLQLAATLVVVLVAVIGPSTIQGAAFRAANRDPSLSGRSDLWSAVLHEGLKSPVFGSGYGAFWYEGRGREIVGTWNPRQSHNAYLDVFVDLGVAGLLAVVILFAGTVWCGWMRLGAGGATAPRARAVAAMVAVTLALMTLYGWGESFLLKLDKLPMLTVLWFVLLIGNRGENRIEAEFAADEA